ncbi:hypothetical protein FOL47_003656 [Perkinsus chesapeaki]|uniref:WRKY19-like zinc finger domain-containing protein n=1 Tax=Perkinsus chesapeaki TaxID=330153 RepID=A0A7J6M6W7_PERCH|nr:hypothetical protein FOL47_003656 [Perkinsus chesapeaki]
MAVGGDAQLVLLMLVDGLLIVAAVQVEGCDKTARRQGLCQRHGGRPDHVRAKKSSSSSSKKKSLSNIETLAKNTLMVPKSLKSWDLWLQDDEKLLQPKRVEIRENVSRGMREYVIYV